LAKRQIRMEASTPCREDRPMIFMEETSTLSGSHRRLGDEDGPKSHGKRLSDSCGQSPGAVTNRARPGGAVKAKPPAASAAPIQEMPPTLRASPLRMGAPHRPRRLATGLVPRTLLSTAHSNHAVISASSTRRTKVVYYTYRRTAIPRSPGFTETVQTPPPRKPWPRRNRSSTPSAKRKNFARFWLEMGGNSSSEYHPSTIKGRLCRAR
jgi:hypothetical protein